MKTIQFNANKNIVFQKVREARQKAGLSQSKLAAKLQTYGISIDQQAISRIEKNQRIVTDYEVACICLALHVTSDWLLANIEKELPS